MRKGEGGDGGTYEKAARAWPSSWKDWESRSARSRRGKAERGSVTPGI